MPAHVRDIAKKTMSSWRLGCVRGVSLGMQISLAMACSVGNLKAATGEDPKSPEPVVITEKPEINVLLLGYYIWAHPNYVELCKKEGIKIYGPMATDPTGADPKNYSVEFLKQFHVVIASGPLERPWDPQVVREGIKPGVVANLLEYNRQGGGLLFTPLGAGYGADAWNESIGKRIDAVALNEALDDPSHDVSVSLMASFRDRMRYIWTTDIKPHPVTEGVRGLFFGRIGEWGWPATIPMKFGKSWEVIVRGMDSARTTINGIKAGSGERVFKFTDQTGTYSTRPEVVGVRDAEGERVGRMMVQPIYTAWTWGNYGHPAMKEAFLFNGDGIHFSDGQRLLLNSWRWLAEPALAGEGFGGYQPPKKKPDTAVDLTPAVWKDVDWTNVQSEPGLRGLFGAFSAQGGGTGTVADWAKAAREAGLDYLVFTDDPNKHTPETYKALVEECRKNSDEKFVIVPGFGAYDVNGVYRFYPGAPFLPERKYFDEQGRIIQPTGLALSYAWTIGQVPAELGKMPYNPWWEHVVMACAPLTYDGRKLVDDSVNRWLLNCEANDMHLLPISLVRLKAPKSIGPALEKAHMTVLRTQPGADISQFARKGAGGEVLPSYLTNGPVISVWRSENVQGEPFRPNTNRFRILLKTTSDVGLAEVKLIDAADGSIYRRWKPTGEKEFTAVIEENTGDQRTFGLFVTDVNGHTAIAPPVYTYQGANRVWHMGDRLMGLMHTTSWDQSRQKLVTHGTPTGVNYHKGAPDGGGEFTTDHIESLKIQGTEGSGIYPPAFKIKPRLQTDLGTEPTNLVMRYTRLLAGHDLTVFDYKGDYQAAADKKFEFSNPPRPLQETKIANITSRSWNIRSSSLAPVVMMLNEIKVLFKQDVYLKELELARYQGPDFSGEFDTLMIKAGPAEPALTWKFEQGETFKRTTDFLPGGYLYQAKSLAGTMGFIALDDKITVHSEARVHRFMLSKPYLKKYKAGDHLTIRMLRVSRAFEAQQGSNEWLEKFIHDYGIASPPGYKYRVTQGTLKNIAYVLDMDQQNGGATVEIKKYDLPQPLPIRVSGVRKNAIFGEYDLDTKRVRPLPYFEGSVTTSLETQLKDTRLYIGEWMSWDNATVRVSLVSEGTDFLLEAHNPSDKEVTCVFTGAIGFAPLKGFQKEIKIPAYSSIKEKIGSNPETVKLVPIQ